MQPGGADGSKSIAVHGNALNCTSKLPPQRVCRGDSSFEVAGGVLDGDRAGTDGAARPASSSDRPNLSATVPKRGEKIELPIVICPITTLARAVVARSAKECRG